MTAGTIEIRGAATPGETAVLLAAIETLLAEEHCGAPTPAPVSGWRAEARREAVGTGSPWQFGSAWRSEVL